MSDCVLTLASTLCMFDSNREHCDDGEYFLEHLLVVRSYGDRLPADCVRLLIGHLHEAIGQFPQSPAHRIQGSWEVR